jgi:hypothetical protein
VTSAAEPSHVPVVKSAVVLRAWNRVARVAIVAHSTVIVMKLAVVVLAWAPPIYVVGPMGTAVKQATNV